MVPEEKRKHKDFNWLTKNMHKLQVKYSGKFIAVVNEKFSIGNTAISAYNKAKKLFPNSEPIMDVVPAKNCLLL